MDWLSVVLSLAWVVLLAMLWVRRRARRSVDPVAPARPDAELVGHLTAADRAWLVSHGWEPPLPDAPVEPKRATWQTALERELAREATRVMRRDEQRARVVYAGRMHEGSSRSGAQKFLSRDADWSVHLEGGPADGQAHKVPQDQVGSLRVCVPSAAPVVAFRGMCEPPRPVTLDGRVAVYALSAMSVLRHREWRRRVDRGDLRLAGSEPRVTATFMRYDED